MVIQSERIPNSRADPAPQSDRSRQSIDFRDKTVETRLSPPQPPEPLSLSSSTTTLPIRSKAKEIFDDSELVYSSKDRTSGPVPASEPKHASHKSEHDDPFTEPVVEPQDGSTQTTRSATTLTTPLLQDASMFANNYVPQDDEETTLEELAHLVRLSKYQQRKCATTRNRLQKTLISTSLNARLTRCGEVANRHLADSFRKDDKDGFAFFYNAIQDVRKSCDELRRFALLDPDMNPLASPSPGPTDTLHVPTDSSQDPLKPMVPFLDDLTVSTRESILDFLTDIRTNPEYLAMRIHTLRSSELQVFLLPHKGFEPAEAVRSSHGRSSTRSQSSIRSQGNAELERLLSFHRHDPLSILVHSCFANSAGPDSSEDRRRTEIWAMTLARVIKEGKSNGEQFVMTVMSIWTAMRDWSGRSSMEWFLMRILEDGAFLLDPAEDQHGTRFNLSDWTQSDEEAATDFYSRAVDELFELVDDADATGIPDGLLELGNAMLFKLEELEFKYVENTSRWMVWRCLFSVFLLGVIVHPEAYGMLTEYHITPYAREKILKKVALKAQEYVSTMWSGIPGDERVPTDIPLHIRDHITSIASNFRGQKAKNPASRLLPARSVTSLRETAEVHPYLVISPAEIVTLVNALFPEQRLLSTISIPSMPTPGAAASGASTPVHFPDERLAATTASEISTSPSSTRSDVTDHQMQQPMNFGARDLDMSSSPLGEHSDRKFRFYEDDGYKLRLALHEMSQTLGSDAVSGTIHPCAERWAVLFVSADGHTLSTSIGHDPPNEVDDNESWSSSDIEDVDDGEDVEGHEDFHQLRDSVLRLVEDFEIPQSAKATSEATFLSNRTSRLRKYKSKSVLASPKKTQSGGRPESLYQSPSHPRPTLFGLQAKPGDTAEEAEESILVTMLKAAAAQSKAQADFVSSHVYWRTLSQLSALESETLKRNHHAALISIFSRGPRDSIRRSAAGIEEFDAWLVWLKQSQDRHEGSIRRMMKRSSALRDKMWYVTDVRNSKEFGHSRDICQALKAMGTPRRWKHQRTRSTNSRGPNSAYLYRTESQIMDLLSAPEDQGGPNKLSDDQAEMASQWLKQNGVENFCQGEERIHRFCCEIDKCISKLIGNNIHEAPVLWSSDLYKRDKLVFERVRRTEAHSSMDDTASIMSADDRRYPSIGHRSASMTREFRTWSPHGMSQKSFDSLRMTPSRPLSDHYEPHHYQEKLSPMHTGDSGSAFWSPFQSGISPMSAVPQAYSPTTSLTNLSATFSGIGHHGILPSSSSVSAGRPGTSASSTDTVFQRKVADGKARFLEDLRQSLTSLILSDLGTTVLSKGSETDHWFQGLGQECINRRDALDARARAKLGKHAGSRGTRPRVIEKKKSFGDLRGAGDASSQSKLTPEQPSTPTSSDTPTEPTRAAVDQFPFRKAYERLLVMFRVHPNPVSKLQALKELEDLILASVSAASRSKRSRRHRADTVTDFGRGGPENRSGLLDRMIDNAKRRRSVVMQPSTYNLGSGYQRDFPTESRSIASVTNTNLEAATQELQQLFRDANVRPRALFRDLQLIAAFVPSALLDKPEFGRSFWNTSLAALMLKSEVCQMMVEMADDVVAARTHTRPAAGNDAPPDVPVSTTGTPPPPSSKYTLEDAGKMWSITAKEGSATAQRELALFYLSNPEFVERTTLPLSKPREVFKQSVMNKYGRPSGSSTSSTGMVEGPGKGGGDIRNDPGLMCVAVHWMEAAERGGDELAISFLRQNEFMEMK